jgi:hypothetical protein
MKGRIKPSAVWLMGAVLIACVLSTSVFSGEHPWDSDRRPDSSGTGPAIAISDPITIADTLVRPGQTSSAAAGAGSSTIIDYLQSLVFRVARGYADWFRPSKSRSTQSSRW